jgi:hypothetical protein
MLLDAIGRQSSRHRLHAHFCDMRTCAAIRASVHQCFMVASSVDDVVANAPISTGQMGLFEKLGIRSCHHYPRLIGYGITSHIFGPTRFREKSILVTVRCSMDCFARRALVSLLRSAETDSQSKPCNGSAALAG